jgi:hypothetical protein
MAFERLVRYTIMDSESKDGGNVPEESEGGCVCLMKERG